MPRTRFGLTIWRRCDSFRVGEVTRPAAAEARKINPLCAGQGSNDVADTTAREAVQQHAILSLVIERLGRASRCVGHVARALSGPLNVTEQPRWCSARTTRSGGAA